jgi:hypothetical protein
MNRLLLPSTNPPTQGQARRKKSNTLAELHKKMINSNFATDRGLFCKHRKERIVDVTVKKKIILFAWYKALLLVMKFLQ